jgi:hypothetical protein
MTTANRAFAQFLLRPVLGLPTNLVLDELPGHLIAEGTGDLLQLGELGTMRQAIGVKLSPQFPGNLTQSSLKLTPNPKSILAHFRGILHVANQKTQTAQTSRPIILTTFPVVQTLSCAHHNRALTPRIDTFPFLV